MAQVFTGNPSQSYGASPAIWDHTVLPATRHRRTRPAITPAMQAGTRITYPRGIGTDTEGIYNIPYLWYTIGLQKLTNDHHIRLVPR